MLIDISRIGTHVSAHAPLTLPHTHESAPLIPDWICPDFLMMFLLFSLRLHKIPQIFFRANFILATIYMYAFFNLCVSGVSRKVITDIYKEWGYKSICLRKGSKIFLLFLLFFFPLACSFFLTYILLQSLFEKTIYVKNYLSKNDFHKCAISECACVT